MPRCVTLVLGIKVFCIFYGNFHEVTSSYLEAKSACLISHHMQSTYLILWTTLLDWLIKLLYCNQVRYWPFETKVAEWLLWPGLTKNGQIWKQQSKCFGKKNTIWICHIFVGGYQATCLLLPLQYPKVPNCYLLYKNSCLVDFQSVLLLLERLRLCFPTQLLWIITAGGRLGDERGWK